MSRKEILGSVVHKMPPDLRVFLVADKLALAKWNDITSLARNEWICWTVSVKKPAKRKEHIRRVISELKEGMRRPCCWVGCIHRKDKPLSPSQKFVLGRRGKNEA